VHAGLAVITGSEDRQHAYVALTRGTDANLAHVLTVSPARADPAPGPLPSWPVTTRFIPNESAIPPRPPRLPPAGTAPGVLSAVLDHDRQQLSATQTPPGRLSRFPAVKPQRWLAASFEHHCGPHALPGRIFTTSSLPDQEA